MTEDEAKTKWCPHVRVMSDEGSMIIATVNRGGGLQADVHCLASDCMMWVWDMSPHDAAAINARGNADQKAQGHCGLIKG